MGICLKRYSVHADGTPKRRNIHVDIPLEIGLPHFVNDETAYDDGPLFTHFKLSLQSIVCHRGKSVDSGHYIALVKDGLATAQSQMAANEIDNYGTWLLFDDLAKDRVQKVDIAEALREESPYLLFYQVQPIDDASASQRHPPLYSEITRSAKDDNANEDRSATLDKPDKTANAMDSLSLEKTVDDRTTQISSGTALAQQVVSSEQLSKPRGSELSNDDNSLEASPAPLISTPVPQDETKSGYFSSSRRTSKIGMRGSWSRASSQSGDGSRLSFTIGRRNVFNSGEKNTVSAEASTQNRGMSDNRQPENPERKLEPNLPLGVDAPTRSKSRKDSRRQRVSMQIERAMNDKLPDRQCLML